MEKQPVRLKSGELIGVVSPSSPTTPEALDRLADYFARRGYRVKIGSHALAKRGFMAGDPQLRADDLSSMFQDSNVRMIMTSTGGKSAAHLLPLLDYRAIAADPKIFVGLSDSSILLNAITSKTHIPTFHGPNGYNFGHKGITRFSEENFWRLVGEPVAIPYDFPVQDAMVVIKGEERIEGPLYGGHMGTIQALIGTEWEPEWQGSILFLEEITVEYNRIDAILTHLRLAGILKKIKGLVLGQLVDCKETTYPQTESIEEILKRQCAEYEFPIVTNIPLGHTNDKITLPLGCLTQIDPRSRTMRLLESPTTAD